MRLVGHDRLILKEGRFMGIGNGVNTDAVDIGCRRMIGIVVRMVSGKVRGEEADKRVEILRPKELYSVLPLISIDEIRVRDDHERGRFEQVIQLA